MSVTAEQVKALRSKTDAPVLICQNALREVGGDIERAILWLKENGQGSSRSVVPTEGAIGTWSADSHKLIVVAIGKCETDFAARTDSFKGAIETAARMADTSDLDQVNVRFEELTSGLRERCLVESCDSMTASGESEWVAVYLHHDNRRAALVKYSGDPTWSSTQDALAAKVGAHVVAMNPTYVNVSALDPQVVADLENGFREEAKGKPVQAIEKIVSGKMAKALSELQVLGEQPWYADAKQPVKQILRSGGIEILEFKSFIV
jgi:elongation factor Ts